VSAEATESLRQRLARCPQIARLSTPDWEEPGTLAHALADLADASRGYLELLPTLLNDQVEGEELMSALTDVESELQHMAYHLEDPRVFRALLDPLRAEWRKARS
jgi:hypothetical protein